MTYDFLRRDTLSCQEPCVFKLDEANHIKAGVDGGEVVIVGRNHPVVASWGSGEMNLNKT